MRNQAEASPATESRILWQHELADRWGLDRTTIWRYEREGKIPPADIVLGRRRGRFLETIEKFERSTVGAAS